MTARGVSIGLPWTPSQRARKEFGVSGVEGMTDGRQCMIRVGESSRG